jgi:hypothetical protein
MSASGPYVPIESWPEATRAAIAGAYVDKATAAADRIREQARSRVCRCAEGAVVELADDGRCARCWGWRHDWRNARGLLRPMWSREP